MTHRRLVLAAAALLAAAPLAAQQTPDLTPYLTPDRAAEIALARSAAAKNISDSASVLVLTRNGYIEAVKGTNGFTCFVQHSFDADIGDPNFWDSRNRGPMCLNPPATRSMLPEMRKRAEWIMAGVSTAEIAARTRRAYASHEFAMPAAGAMAYMLSPHQRLGSDDTHWLPHLMFFYDRSVPAAAWGVGGSTNTVIDGSAGHPESPILTLLVPVRRWSDGTTAVPEGGK
jgi:hypothetical protein